MCDYFDHAPHSHSLVRAPQRSLICAVLDPRTALLSVALIPQQATS